MFEQGTLVQRQLVGLLQCQLLYATDEFLDFDNDLVWLASRLNSGQEVLFLKYQLTVHQIFLD